MLCSSAESALANTGIIDLLIDRLHGCENDQLYRMHNPLPACSLPAVVDFGHAFTYNVLKQGELSAINENLKSLFAYKLQSAVNACSELPTSASGPAGVLSSLVCVPGVHRVLREELGLVPADGVVLRLQALPEVQAETQWREAEAKDIQRVRTQVFTAVSFDAVRTIEHASGGLEALFRSK